MRSKAARLWRRLERLDPYMTCEEAIKGPIKPEGVRLLPGGSGSRPAAPS